MLWVPKTTSTQGAFWVIVAAVLLRQAAADRDLHAGPLRLHRRQVAEVAVELVVGVLPHRAGVEDDHVGLLAGRRRDVARLLEQAGQPLGVVDVHLAPVGADLVGTHDRSRVGGFRTVPHSQGHTSRVRVRLELWSKDQGGRHTPVFDGYRPDFRASTEGHGDVDLGVAAIKLPADNPMLVPGTAVDVDVAAGRPVGLGQREHRARARRPRGRPAGRHRHGASGMSSRWSIGSRGSVLSLWSDGSVLSIGSVGSFASIGSVGSFASGFSIGSSQSLGSWLSHQSTGSVLSHQSDGSVLSSQATRALLGRRTDGKLPSGSVFALAALSVAASGRASVVLEASAIACSGPDVPEVDPMPYLAREQRQPDGHTGG